MEQWQPWRNDNKALSAKDRQLRQVTDEVAEKQRRLDEVPLEYDELSGESRGRRSLHESEIRGNRLQEQSDGLRAQLARCEEVAHRVAEEQRRARVVLERVPWAWLGRAAEHTNEPGAGEEKRGNAGGVGPCDNGSE